ncbi:hypothetical protein ACQJBY_069693 [Aegilops geniculata]
MHIGRRPHAWPRWASSSPFVQVQELPSSTDLTDQGGGEGRTPPLHRRRLQTHPPLSLTPVSRRACPSLRRPSSLSASARRTTLACPLTLDVQIKDSVAGTRFLVVGSMKI